ncbi:hypothetical protein RKD54_003616 [Pseudarthrobacter sp. SLBN-100]
MGTHGRLSHQQSRIYNVLNTAFLPGRKGLRCPPAATRLLGKRFPIRELKGFTDESEP